MNSNSLSLLGIMTIGLILVWGSKDAGGAQSGPKALDYHNTETLKPTSGFVGPGPGNDLMQVLPDEGGLNKLVAKKRPAKSKKIGKKLREYSRQVWKTKEKRQLKVSNDFSKELKTFFETIDYELNGMDFDSVAPVIIHLTPEGILVTVQFRKGPDDSVPCFYGLGKNYKERYGDNAGKAIDGLCPALWWKHSEFAYHVLTVLRKAARSENAKFFRQWSQSAKNVSVMAFTKKGTAFVFSAPITKSGFWMRPPQQFFIWSKGQLKTHFGPLGELFTEPTKDARGKPTTLGFLLNALK